MLSKEELETLYYKQELSLARIAKQAGVSTQTVLNWMRRYSLPRRSLSEAWKTKQDIPTLLTKMHEGGKKHVGSKRWNWKPDGSKRDHPEGYVYVKCTGHPRGDWVFEHILIVEEHLGRHLVDGEEIHHKNQNKQDNRLENLVLFLNHSEHLLSFNHRKGGR